MIGRFAITLLAAGSLLGAVGPARGDTIQLANGDVLRGKVVSLNEKELVFHSESFGTIKIERTKVDLIAARLQRSAECAPGGQSRAGGECRRRFLTGKLGPPLGNADRSEEPGSDGRSVARCRRRRRLAEKRRQARRGLQDLKKDLGSGPESQALDAYINLLNQFAPLSAAAGQQLHPAAPRPSPQKPKSPSTDKKVLPVQKPSGTTSAPR